MEKSRGILLLRTILKVIAITVNYDNVLRGSNRSGALTYRFENLINGY